MSVPDGDWPYWSVDLPGLSQAQAQELLAVAEQAGMPSGIAIDPALFLTLHLDKATVDGLVRLLDAVQASRLKPELVDMRIITGILEILREWNENAPPE